MDFSNPKQMYWVATGVLLVSLLLNLGVGFGAGIDRPMTSDPFYFRHLAENMAAGEGYVIKEGFWPAEPTMRRLPGWPVAILFALKMMPFASPDTAMRVMGLLINSFVPLLLFVLTYRLLRRIGPAVVAGLGYAIHPSALHGAYFGLSEPFFLLLVAAGVVLLLSWPRLPALAGVLLLGCACLVRANFVLWIGFFVVLYGLYALCTRVQLRPRLIAQAAICILLFCIPPGLWMWRNSRVCGHFPVMSTLRGQTFYGGNNQVVAENLEFWGYWVFPDSVPGETPMRELAATKSEYEVDDYYYRKGTAYITGNIMKMPRLWLGKLVRAYVPIPWKPSMGSYAVSAFRWLLYAGVVLGLCVGWRGVRPVYHAALLSILATGAVAVLGFWGCARFAFAMEPFLLPIVGAGAASLPTTLKRFLPSPVESENRP